MTRGPDASHAQNVRKVALPKSILPKAPFSLKACTFVEADGSLVVYKHLQFQACEIEPIVCQIDECRHERTPYALVLPFLMHRNPHAGDMLASGSWMACKRCMRDYAVFKLDHELVHFIRGAGEPLAPYFCRWIRQLQGARIYAGAAEDGQYIAQIFGAGGANSQVFHAKLEWHGKCPA
jgi:hypothetical protein